MIHLNEIIEHTLQQYAIASVNCCVNVFHIDDNKEQYSSFDRFKLYEVGKPTPVESINIEYNFLIILPESKKSRSYKISINIYSIASLKKRLKDESDGVIPIFRYAFSNTARYKIEYIDFAVARTLQSAIDKWFSGLESSKKKKHLAFLQRNSHFFSPIFKYFAAIFSSIAIIITVNKFYEINIGTKDLLLSILTCFMFIFITMGISESLGKILERRIDSISPNSYLKINRGDDKAIIELESENKSNYIRGTLSIAIAFFINIVSSYIFYLIQR